MDVLLLAHLSFGPLMLILGYLYKRFPPKKVNHWYGYRTSRSMKSQEAWNCANCYSANAFIIIALLTCFVQLVCYTLLEGESAILWAAGFMTIGVLAVIPLTEFHLKKKGF